MLVVEGVVLLLLAPDGQDDGPMEEEQLLETSIRDLEHPGGLETVYLLDYRFQMEIAG